MKVVVVMPCQNEAKYVAGLIEALMGKVDAVVISDDGSLDGTREEATKAGAIVVGHNEQVKHGYGITLRRGIKTAMLTQNPDVLVFMDGDGQHSPEDIEAVLSPIVNREADVVLGSRLGPQDKRPFYRRLSNSFGTLVANVGAQQKVTDAITGYWAITAHCLPVMTENGWGVSFENLAKCRTMGMRIVSVPIKAIWHKELKENSTSNSVILGLIVLWKILKWRFLCEVRPVRLTRWFYRQLHKKLVYPDYNKGGNG